VARTRRVARAAQVVQGAKGQVSRKGGKKGNDFSQKLVVKTTKPHLRFKDLVGGQ